MSIYSNIKMKLRENKKIASVIRLLKYTEACDIITSVYDMGNDDLTLFYRKLGELNPSVRIYLIEYGVRDMDYTGFFALVRQCCYKFQFAEYMNLTPYIYWGPKICYAEKKELFNTNNVFEYYYEPVSEIKYEDVLRSQCVCQSKYKDCFFLDKARGSYKIDKREIKILSDMYKKYFILNSNTSKYIVKNIEYLIGKKKMLGVHVRGGDFKNNYNNHPVFQKFDIYLSESKHEYEQHKYEGIFLATDDEEALKLFRNEFKEKLFFYSDFKRTTGKEALHLKKNDRNLHNYRMGLEVLRDAYTLSACQGLISGLSQVAFAARYIKMSRSETYLFDKIVDAGVNENKNICP